MLFSRRSACASLCLMLFAAPAAPLYAETSEPPVEPVQAACTQPAECTLIHISCEQTVAVTTATAEQAVQANRQRLKELPCDVSAVGQQWQGEAASCVEHQCKVIAKDPH